MKIEVRHAIADIIIRQNVDYVFGHTGGHIRQLWDAITQSGVKTIFNKIEGNGVFMAIGHYQQSRQIGVVLGTSGPGVQNMVIATASAHLDSIPVVIIGAAVPTFIAGKNALQDSSGRGRSVEQRLIFQACTKAAITVNRPENVPNVIREAFRVALSGRPGPVFVEVPSDFWNTKIEYDSLDPHQYHNIKPVCGEQTTIDQVMSVFYKSKRPVIAVGEGAAVDQGVKQKLNNFLQQTGVPFTASPLAKDLVDETSPLYLGALRLTPGKRCVYDYLLKSDFVLSLGNRFEQWEWEWTGDKSQVMPLAKVAQVDYDPQEIGRVYPADYSVLSNIEQFIDQCKIEKHPAATEMRAELSKHHQEKQKSYQKIQDKNGIHPKNILLTLQDLLPQDSCIVCDTGNIGSLTIVQLRTSLNQRFLHAQRNSPMGYAIPASLGASLKHRGPVICLVGDGSFNMTGNELGLLLNYDLKVIFVIADDGGCTMIKDGNQGEYGHTNMTQFNNPDYCLLAKAYGLKSYPVKNKIEFKTAVEKAIKSDKSVIIHAQIGEDVGVWEE